MKLKNCSVCEFLLAYYKPDMPDLKYMYLPDDYLALHFIHDDN